MREYTISGYVVIPSLSEWDKVYADTIIPAMSMSTFATTAAEAWAKKAQTLTSDIDYSRRVTAWFDRGYRVKEAKLTIYE